MIWLCRPDDGIKGKIHYWDDETNQDVSPPEKPCYTPEKLCPRHKDLILHKEITFEISNINLS